MKNEELSKKIKELRHRKGYSQDELAEKSGLSLRTIQRIENGETEPLGDSLKRLADAFDVAPDEITDWQIQEDPNYLMLLHLSALAFVFPLLGIIIPLALWIIKKDKIKNVDKIGKAILNFQITWTILIFMIAPFMLVIKMFTDLQVSLFSLIMVLCGLYLFNIIMIIVNTIRTSRKKETYFFPILKLLR
ncbi:MAG: helix-turn-helix domain-containing protein [Bacteroidota bacterium]